MLAAPYVLQTQFFTLKIKPGRKATRLTLSLLIDETATSDFPETLEILKYEFPDVLKTACFNEKKLPFREEVKNTEIGHLFEHLLIASLRKIRVSQGHRAVIYDGTTSWNWIRQPRGVFNIKVTSGIVDLDIFQEALENSIVHTQSILLTRIEVREPVLSPTPAFAFNTETSYLRRRARPPFRPARA